MIGELTNEYYRTLIPAYCNYALLLSNGQAIGHGTELTAGANAAIALYHFMEHPGNPYNFNELNDELEEFGFIADVANIFKHHKRDRKPKGRAPLIQERNQVREVVICNKYTDAIGHYVHEEKDVILYLVKERKFRRASLYRSLTHVINMWGRKLKELGVIEDPQYFQDKSTYGFVPRNKAVKLKTLTLSFNYRVEHDIIFQTYDPKTNSLIMDPDSEQFLRRLGWEHSKKDGWKILTDTPYNDLVVDILKKEGDNEVLIASLPIDEISNQK